MLEVYSLGVRFCCAAGKRLLSRANENKLYPFAFSGTEQYKLQKIFDHYKNLGHIADWSYYPIKEYNQRHLLSVRGREGNVLYLAKEPYSGHVGKPRYLMNYGCSIEAAVTTVDFQQVLMATESHFEWLFSRPYQSVSVTFDIAPH